MTTSLISDSQKDFIISSIKNDFRIDGRSNKQPQQIKLTINNLDHLLGSSLLNIQSSQNQTHIYTGIKLKVQKQQGNKKDPSKQCITKNIKQRLFLELGCIKKLSQQQEQVRTYIEEYLNKYIVNNFLDQFQQLLKIPQAKRHYLTINIEVYILSTPHISYLQYLFLSVKSAIQNIRLPQFDIAYNQITDEEIVEIKVVEEILQIQNENSTSEKRQKNSTPYKGLSALKIVGVLQDSYVQGLTVQEYEAVDSCILIALDSQQRLVSFQTLKGQFKIQQMHQIIKFSKN